MQITLMNLKMNYICLKCEYTEHGQELFKKENFFCKKCKGASFKKEEEDIKKIYKLDEYI